MMRTRPGLHVLLWSQMHGDEPTVTAALFDVFEYVRRYRREPVVHRMRSHAGSPAASGSVCTTSHIDGRRIDRKGLPPMNDPNTPSIAVSVTKIG
jgi:hypothetical protein